MIEALQNRPGYRVGYHESHGLTSRTGNAFLTPGKGHLGAATGRAGIVAPPSDSTEKRGFGVCAIVRELALGEAGGLDEPVAS
jgi:hypothetical protein